jgi:hypothetical protein
MRRTIQFCLLFLLLYFSYKLLHRFAVDIFIRVEFIDVQQPLQQIGQVSIGCHILKFYIRNKSQYHLRILGAEGF